MLEVDSNIRLEELDMHHAQALFDLVNANRVFLREWLPWVDHITEVKHFEDYIAFTREKNAQGLDKGFVIFYDNHLAGRIGLHYIDDRNSTASIGYWLAENYQQKGIIHRSCNTIINYGFRELGLNRIEIKCGTGNRKSAALPVKLGFRKEGTLRQAEWVNDRFIDLDLYAILKTEWEKAG